LLRVIGIAATLFAAVIGTPEPAVLSNPKKKRLGKSLAAKVSSIWLERF
jgi:hypothetical protein